MSPLIELHGYGFRATDTDTWLLRNISLTIPPGMRVGIIGPSGSGKTTLSHVLAGVESLTLHGVHSGTIMIDGQQRTTADDPARTMFYKTMNVGIVLQNPESQIFAETVLEEVQYGLQECTEKAAIQSLHAVGLESFAATPVRMLSLGQKQRVVIASFLASGPQLLILDEPTNYLDPASATELFAYLQTLPITQIIVEHDTERLCGYADHIIEMEHGEIIAQGTPVSWLHHTRNVPRFYRSASLLSQSTPERNFLLSGGQFTVSDSVVPILQHHRLPPEPVVDTTLIECTNLFSGYRPGNPVIKSITFSALAGERIALLGLNGSGKTTLLKCIAGLLEPHEGSISLEGSEPRPGTAGYLYQNPDYQLFEQTVEAECVFTLRLRNIPEPEIRERMYYWLGATNLLHLRDRLPFTLSYGEKRRLTLASVLMAQSRVLLFDEPTTALDDANVQLLLELCTEISAERKRMLLFSTHDLDFALDTATRIIILEDGRIVKDTPRQTLTYDDIVHLKIPLPFICSVLHRTGSSVPPLGTNQLSHILKDIQ